VQDEPGVHSEPPLDRRGLVGRVVLEHDAYIEVLGGRARSIVCRNFLNSTAVAISMPRLTANRIAALSIHNAAFWVNDVFGLCLNPLAGVRARTAPLESFQVPLRIALFTEKVRVDG
jgi:hypothetical protein